LARKKGINHIQKGTFFEFKGKRDFHSDAVISDHKDHIRVLFGNNIKIPSPIIHGTLSKLYV
jgi:hypothetical protein